MNEDNGDHPPCATCQRPTELTKRNAEAWSVFRDLDEFGREVDTMGGVPLNLRLESILRACRRTTDPVGIEWRVKELDRIVTKYRREDFKRRQNDKEE